MPLKPVSLSLVLAVLMALSACHRDGDAPQGVAGVRAALAARNYAEAERLGRAAAIAHPKDPAAQFELARAEALLGNQGMAMDALEAAVQAGLPDAPRAIEDPAFAALGQNERLAALRHRLAPPPALLAGSGVDHVQIRRNGQGTEIQAGDVHLKTDF